MGRLDWRRAGVYATVQAFERRGYSRSYIADYCIVRAIGCEHLRAWGQATAWRWMERQIQDRRIQELCA